MSIEMSSAIRSAAYAQRRPTGCKSIGGSVAALLLWVLFPGSSHADTCTVTPTNTAQEIPVTPVGGGPLTINPNAAPNTLLGKLSVLTTGYTTGITCQSMSDVMTMDGAGPVMGTIASSLIHGGYPGNATLYQSNVPGIAYAVSWDGAGWAGWMPQSRVGFGWQLYSTNPSTLTIYLVKTSEPIPAGINYLGGTLATWTMFPSNTRWINYVYSGSIPVVPKIPACTVDLPSRNISVTLPDQSADGFGGVGTTAGTAQNFSINLTCSGGDPGTSANMYVTLTDATNPGNTTDMLSPTAATANTGVGVRIFNGATPVKYGADSSTIGNTNQWRVTTVNPGSSTVSIPLTATYVQVGSTVHGGAVSAIATFTMAYN